MCLSNAQGHGSGSSGKPTAATALIICLKKNRHDSNLGSRKSREKHWILKSYTCRLELEDPSDPKISFNTATNNVEYLFSRSWETILLQT